MSSFIFKSQGLIKKLNNKLEIIQSELRHQRADNQQILFLLNKLLVNKNLQHQVDEYFEEGDEYQPGLEGTRTPPQTDADNIGEAPDSD